MASFQALTTVCDAVVHLLRMSYRPSDFNNELEFKVFTPRDFGSGAITNGVSLFLYRVVHNGTHRLPTGRPMAGGRARTQLPLDLHFLMTVWGQQASLQSTLAGWMMRTLEDTPILSPGILNAVTETEVFRADETVELSLTELSNEDLLRIWEVLGLGVYQLSIPYIARVVYLESTQPLPVDTGPAVQDRGQGLATPPTGEI